MGTEKQLTELLVLDLQGGGINNPAGLRMTGGSPNHKALARVVGYAWGLSHPADRDEARARVLEFLENQESNHMGFGEISEFGTSSHFAWWQNAMAGLWKLAEKEDDREVLERTRAWWVREVAVESLCATPGGSVVLPGARTHVVKGYADQRRQRDVGRALILGRETRIPRDVRAGKPSLDHAGLWMLHKLLPEAELRAVAAAPAEWPVPLNTLYVRKSEAGHVAWFDRFTGLCPSFYAWAEYATGEERYGAHGDWKKNHPGGPRPADLPVPEVPGEVAETVVIQGREVALAETERN
jgi:hypothetical protein